MSGFPTVQAPTSIVESVLLDGADAQQEFWNPGSRTCRIRFLKTPFSQLDDFTVARKSMGLVVHQSSKKHGMYRLKCRKSKKLCTFKHKKLTGMYSLAAQAGCKSLEQIMQQWSADAPMHEDITAKRGVPIIEDKRRSNVIWVRAAVEKLLDLIDYEGRRFSISQIVSVLNDDNLKHRYRSSLDHNRKFTRGNIQAMIDKILPSQSDTQVCAYV